METNALINREWICPSVPVEPDSEWNPKENGFRPRILSRPDCFIECSKNTGLLPSFCEASIHLLSYLKKMWPESGYIDVFPVFKEQKSENQIALVTGTSLGIGEAFYQRWFFSHSND